MSRFSANSHMNEHFLNKLRAYLVGQNVLQDVEGLGQRGVVWPHDAVRPDCPRRPNTKCRLVNLVLGHIPYALDH